MSTALSQIEKLKGQANVTEADVMVRGVRASGGGDDDDDDDDVEGYGGRRRSAGAASSSSAARRGAVAGALAVAAGPQMDRLKAQVAQLQQENQELKDKVVRRIMLGSGTVARFRPVVWKCVMLCECGIVWKCACTRDQLEAGHWSSFLLAAGIVMRMGLLGASAGAGGCRGCIRTGRRRRGRRL